MIGSRFSIDEPVNPGGGVLDLVDGLASLTGEIDCPIGEFGGLILGMIDKIV